MDLGLSPGPAEPPLETPAASVFGDIKVTSNKVSDEQLVTA
jgi:hypothetical protein